MADGGSPFIVVRGNNIWEVIEKLYIVKFATSHCIHWQQYLKSHREAICGRKSLQFIVIKDHKCGKVVRVGQSGYLNQI